VNEFKSNKNHEERATRSVAMMSTLIISKAAPRVLATASSAILFYTLSAIRSDGSTKHMDENRGKVVYATNVASM
jgi:hypothetical protein